MYAPKTEIAIDALAERLLTQAASHKTSIADREAFLELLSLEPFFAHKIWARDDHAVAENIKNRSSLPRTNKTLSALFNDILVSTDLSAEARINLARAWDSCEQRARSNSGFVGTIKTAA